VTARSSSFRISNETNSSSPDHTECKKEDEVSRMSSQARIGTLQKASSNGWIAFSADEEHLIAFGVTYDEVVANAERQGVVDLVVVKVPETRVYRVRQS
jgi:predicted RNase H-like HicB family nuclease